MRTGDIIFFKSDTFISKLIIKLTNSPYSHVALYIGNNEVIEADRFIKVRKRTLGAKEIIFVKETSSLLSEQQKINLVSVASSYIGRDYDYKKILVWLIRLLFRRETRLVDDANGLICSELIDRAFADIGVDLVPEREDGDVLPSHLLNIHLGEK